MFMLYYVGMITIDVRYDLKCIGHHVTAMTTRVLDSLPRRGSCATITAGNDNLVNVPEEELILHVAPLFAGEEMVNNPIHIEQQQAAADEDALPPGQPVQEEAEEVAARPHDTRSKRLKRKNNLKIATLNIRGIREPGSFTGIVDILTAFAVDICVLTETGYGTHAVDCIVTAKDQTKWRIQMSASTDPAEGHLGRRVAY